MGKLQAKIDKNFTVVHNDFIKDKRLGLDEIGMLLKLISLPPNFNFCIEGLAKTVANGKHKVKSALDKLEEFGYFRRTRIIDEKTGRVVDWLYEFSDQVQEDWLNNKDEAVVQNDTDNDDLKDKENIEETPHSDFPDMAEPDMENEPQLNTNIVNTNIINTNLIDRCDDAAEIQKSVEEQIRPDIITQEYGASSEQVEEIVAIITDVYMADSGTVKIDGNAIPIKRVKEVFAKLTPEHIDYVFDNLKKKKSQINNIKRYLITSLYNSVLTYDNHTFAKVHTAMNAGSL